MGEFLELIKYNYQIFIPLGVLATVASAVAAWATLLRKTRHDRPKLRRPDYRMEKKRNEWLVYEAAFLFHEYAPPGVDEHFELMTPEIRQTKQSIHNAIDLGLIKASREARAPDGTLLNRSVGRDEAKKYANSVGKEPRFLFD